MPSGYVNRGERFEDAVRREVLEETGLAAEIDSLLHLNSGFRLRVEAVYAGRIVGGVPRLDPGEVLEMRWFAPDALPGGVLPSHRAIIEAVATRE